MSVFEMTALLNLSVYSMFSLSRFARSYRVTDEALRHLTRPLDI